MLKEKVIYHALFRKTTAFKIALVVIFAMFANVINLAAVAAVNYSAVSEKYVMQLENKLGRIYNVVNLPIQMVNDLFKAESISSQAGAENKSGSTYSYALFIPAKKNTKKAGDLLIFKALVPLGGSGSKPVFKSSQLSPGTLSEFGNCIFRYLESNDIVRYMLLFLMLLLALPRGIPLKIKKIINKKFVFPVFIF